MPTPKPDFFTPATFKSAGAHVLAKLSAADAGPWQSAGVQKSNRKTREGQEMYLAEKFYPADKSKPLAAELSVSLLVGAAGTPRYGGSFVVEQNMSPRIDLHTESASFAELQHWIANLHVPALDGASKKAALVSRIVYRHLSSRP